MEGRASGLPGLLGACRRLSATLVSSLHDRLELLTLEFHEEKLRLIQIVIWLGVAMFTGMLALLYGTFALILAFDPGVRVAVLAVLSVAFLITFAVVVTRLARCLSAETKPFAATLKELDADRACILNED